jgi:hypothetical protein
LARAVSVNFDAVAFGIGRIKRFADQMVGGTDEIPSVSSLVAEK